MTIQISNDTKKYPLPWFIGGPIGILLGIWLFFTGLMGLFGGDGLVLGLLVIFMGVFFFIVGYLLISRAVTDHSSDI
jgi:hypothetical protein